MNLKLYKDILNIKNIINVLIRLIIINLYN